jgi:class 3 adenylate cyclase/putative methionine-R-sulfoxide reductase with GAF domain
VKASSKFGGERAKAQRSNSLEMKNRSALKQTGRRSASVAGEPGEVARLYRDLEEAREQQRATTEVLRTISQSEFQLQAVLQSVAETAARLCRADGAVIFQLEAGVYRFAAGYRIGPAYLEIERNALISPGSGTVIGRAAMTRKVARIEDVLNDALYERKDDANIEGARSMIGVPLMRQGEPVVVIGMARRRVDPFGDREIELATTFAAQAVIAIENARLLNELRQRTTNLTERTAELTEALEQQTAASEVLQVISGSHGDLQPVFASMLEKAVRICDARFGNIHRWDRDALHLVATHNTPPEFSKARRSLPYRLNPKTSLGRMITSKAVVHVTDAAAEPGYVELCDPTAVAAVELGGTRTALYVPMLSDNELIGAFTLSRQEVRPFSDRQIALVTSFAAQAVIAIENARLLQELRERSEQVEAQSLELVKLNQQLEQRVADQVGEIERMSRLRRFLPPQVADLIVASGSEKQLESHRREITALFCDLRGFTGFTENAEASDVMALLRDYHAAIGEIVIKYSGTLERYAGDGVMVVFNDPVPVQNPPLQAVLMALEMRDAIGALTDMRRRLGHDIGFGIGIEHGCATLGTIGFEGRFDYAAIGTVCNVASRLCDEARPGQILISPRVLMAVENTVTVEQVGEFTLKGIRRPLAAYNVLAAVAST